LNATLPVVAPDIAIRSAPDGIQNSGAALFATDSATHTGRQSELNKARDNLAAAKKLAAAQKPAEFVPGDRRGDADEVVREGDFHSAPPETSVFQAEHEVSGEAYRPFPLECLPGPVRRFVAEQAAAIDVDAAAVALPALATLGGMIGCKRKVTLKPGRGGWHEFPIIWAAVVARSGTAKSPAWEAATRPVKELEAELYAGWKREKEQYDALEEKPAGVKPPTRRRVVIDDCTIEVVAQLLGDNPAGLLLARDELDGWWKSHGQYKAKGGADVPNWLQTHRGGQVVVDRKNGTSIFVPRGAVSICGTIQPRILAKVMTPEARACGAAARMLVAMLPRRRRVWTEATLSDETYRGYERVVRGMFNLSWTGEPVVVPLGDDARRLFIEFFNDWNREADDLGDDLAAAWAKLEGYAPRFALIDHLVSTLDALQPSPIGVASMANGIALARWFGREAERVYATLEQTAGESERFDLIEFIRRKGGRVTPRDVRDWNRTAYPTSEAAEAALRKLNVRGRWATGTVGPNGGRPPTWFIMDDK
jgi:hypothetical protein